MKNKLLNIYKNQSILNKLKFMGTFTALISMLISIIFIISYQYIHEKNILKEQTKSFATILAQNIAPAVLFRDMDNVELSLNSIKYQKDIEQVYVIDNDFIVLQSYKKGVIPNEDFDIMDAIPKQKIFWISEKLYLSVPIIENNQTLGFVMIVTSLNTYYTKLFSQLIIILISMLFSMWITLQFTAILRHAILSPIEELNEHIDTIIKTQDLNTKIEILNRDEIGSLGQNFNMMIEDLKKMKHQLTAQRNLAEHDASHDSLTSLLNRRSFTQHLSKAIETSKAQNKSLAIFFIDLDHFKEINDTLGHDTGDMILKIFAERISSCIRATDIFARMGGDEFMLVLRNIDENYLPKNTVSKIMSTMENPIQLKGQEIFIHASIGISHYPKDAQDCETLIKYADKAMYVAKNNGKNQYKFYS